MSKSEQQRMYELASRILFYAIPQEFTSQNYAFQRLICSHIKTNELYASQMKLIKPYHDNKYIRFVKVMSGNRE